MTNIMAMGAALFPSMLILWFFHSRDIHPEPAKVVWKTFALGVLSCIPVLIIGRIIGPVVYNLGSGSFILAGILNAFFIAAIPEEFFKFQVLSRYAMTHKAFDEPMDGMVYGVAASLGFASLENILYVASGGMEVALLRAFTAVPGHAMMGAIMGYYAGQAAFKPDEAASLKRKALWYPILLHGFYDAPLMIMGNTEGNPSTLLTFTMLPIVAGVLLLEFTWTSRLLGLLRAEQLKNQYLC